MKKTCFTLSLLLFTCLLSLAGVHAQPDDFKWSRGPNHLYQVSKWDATARVKRIGFIDNTGAAGLHNAGKSLESAGSAFENDTATVDGNGVESSTSVAH